MFFKLYITLTIYIIVLIIIPVSFYCTELRSLNSSNVNFEVKTKESMMPADRGRLREYNELKKTYVWYMVH